jgi:hypothetical protein
MSKIVPIEIIYTRRANVQCVQGVHDGRQFFAGQVELAVAGVVANTHVSQILLH